MSWHADGIVDCHSCMGPDVLGWLVLFDMGVSLSCWQVDCCLLLVAVWAVSACVCWLSLCEQRQLRPPLAAVGKDCIAEEDWHNAKTLALYSSCLVALYNSCSKCMLVRACECEQFEAH